MENSERLSLSPGVEKRAELLHDEPGYGGIISLEIGNGMEFGEIIDEGLLSLDKLKEKKVIIIDGYEGAEQLALGKPNMQIRMYDNFERQWLHQDRRYFIHRKRKSQPSNIWTFQQPLDPSVPNRHTPTQTCPVQIGYEAFLDFVVAGQSLDLIRKMVPKRDRFLLEPKFKVLRARRFKKSELNACLMERYYNNPTRLIDHLFSFVKADLINSREIIAYNGMERFTGELLDEFLKKTKSKIGQIRWDEKKRTGPSRRLVIGFDPSNLHCRYSEEEKIDPNAYIISTPMNWKEGDRYPTALRFYKE